MNEEIKKVNDEVKESIERLKEYNRQAERAERIAKFTIGATAVVIGGVILATIYKNQ